MNAVGLLRRAWERPESKTSTVELVVGWTLQSVLDLLQRRIVRGCAHRELQRCVVEFHYDSDIGEEPSSGECLLRRACARMVMRLDPEFRWREIPPSETQTLERSMPAADQDDSPQAQTAYQLDAEAPKQNAWKAGGPPAGARKGPAVDQALFGAGWNESARSNVHPVIRRVAAECNRTCKISVAAS